MTSLSLFLFIIPIIAIILLAINLTLAPHNPYEEKDSTFECGFHSFLGQNRTQFSISFFIFALLFLLFDLEILLIYPYVVSSYTNGIYGLVIMLIFILALSLGFAFELGKNALKIDSRQIFRLFFIEEYHISTVFSFYKYRDYMLLLLLPPKQRSISLSLQSELVITLAVTVVMAVTVAAVNATVDPTILAEPWGFVGAFQIWWPVQD